MIEEPDVREARDWQGESVSCTRCEHLLWQETGRCRLGHACVHDRYARRIDRFFRWHPEVAADYLQHPYFEVRAVAAKYVDVFLLPGLVEDCDETVRRSIAERLPGHSRHLKRLKSDPYREVRIRVAQRIHLDQLVSMVDDEDYLVRQHVARRLPPGWLVRMMHDPDTEVRKVVAQRIGSEWLAVMMRDPSGDVRVEAVRRLPAEQLNAFVKEEDWRIRYEVALRISRFELRVLLGDSDPLVREVVEQRLQDHASVVSSGSER